MDNSRSALIFFRSRAACICSGIILFIVTVIALCGGNSLICFSVIATDGIVAAAWVIAAALLGSLILQRFKIRTTPILHVATAGGLGLGIFSLLGLGLGLAGWLNRPLAISLPLISVLLFVVELLRRHSHKSQIDRTIISRWLLEPARTNWLWLVPAVSLAIACTAASVLPGVLWKPLDPHPYDVTSYHLLVPREWYEGGRIVPLDHNVFSYFPFNVEMQFLLLMHATGGPWAGMYACQFLNVGYSILMVLATCGICKDEHSTSNVQHPTLNKSISSVRSSMLDVQCSMFAFQMPGNVGAALASVIPWTLMLAGVAYVESALMLYTALALAWALRAVRSDDRFIPVLILSGVMAGFACGVKITAVPMLLLALPVAVMLVLGFNRKTFIGCAALVLAGSIVLSPWLIRNFAWAGNPLFPIAMKTLGQDHFSNVQVQRFITAHSPTIAQHPFSKKLEVLWNDVLTYWEYGFVILPLGIAACILRWRDRQIWLIFVVGIFILVVWIGFTHLLPRFLVMLIPVAAMAIGRIQWHRAWPVAVILVLTAAGLGWSYVIPELYKQSNPPPIDGQPRVALFGLEDTSFMYQNAPELIAAHDHHLQVALIGDAQAFLYQIPMSHMHYRSVFNVGAGDPIDAWIGPQVKGNPNWLLVINPSEIDRLHTYYRDMPPLPADWAARGPEPFFLSGADLQK